MTKLALSAAVLAAAISTVVPATATAAAAQTPHPPPATATSSSTSTSLQRDAQNLLRLGAPGVLAQVDTPAGQSEVRAGYGNVATQPDRPSQLTQRPHLRVDDQDHLDVRQVRWDSDHIQRHT